MSVHVENAAWSVQSTDPDGNVCWACNAATLRQGRINWRETLQILRNAGYDGWSSVEDFTASETKAKLRDDLAYLREIIG